MPLKSIFLRICPFLSTILLCVFSSCSEERNQAPGESDLSLSPKVQSLGQIVFSSSDTSLVQTFNWAKAQALAYVRKGDPVGLWYEAALPGREAFCMRDVSHQSTGAHVLGLQDHTRNMLHRFAVNISESKDWCTYWEINRHDRPAPVDYRNDQEFWYNLPANFDVIDACYRMYLWTHDLKYLTDPVFLDFYERSLEDYVEQWDLSIEGVLTRERFMNRETYDSADAYQYCRGIPSYHEGDPGKTRVGIDLLAFQAAAYRAYSRILHLRKDRSDANRYARKAKAVMRLIEAMFWNEPQKRYEDLLLTDGRYVTSGGMQAYLLYAGMTLSPERARLAVQSIVHGPSINIEIRSHYPEVFYRYGAPEKATQILLELGDPRTERREYPEVSYAVMGAFTVGLMGIDPSEKFGTISTISRLPRREAWASIENVPYHGLILSLRHDGIDRSTLTNRSDRPLTWIVRFPGVSGRLFHDTGRIKTRKGRDEAGNDFLWGRVVVPPGTEMSVNREMFD